MENTITSKKEQKAAVRKSGYVTVRVNKPTGKLLQQAMDEANKKNFGKRVKVDKVIAKAIGKLTQQDIKEVQEDSLSNQDRLDRDYAAYVSEHGKVSRDEYLGLIMSGKANKSEEVEKTAENS